MTYGSGSQNMDHASVTAVSPGDLLGMQILGSPFSPRRPETREVGLSPCSNKPFRRFWCSRLRTIDLQQKQTKNPYNFGQQCEWITQTQTVFFVFSWFPLGISRTFQGVDSSMDSEISPCYEGSHPAGQPQLGIKVSWYRHRGHQRGLEMRKGAIWAQGNILPGQEVHGQAWSWACQNPSSSCSGASQTWLWLKKTILLIALPKGLNGGGLWRPTIPRQRDWWRQRLWADVLRSLLATHLSPLVIALLLLPRQFEATLAGEFLWCWLPFLGVDGRFWCCLPGGHMNSQAACAFRSCPCFLQIVFKV